MLISQERVYTQYTTHDGLAQIQAKYIHQSPNGLIYIGTKDGVSIFDGTSFNSLKIKDEKISETVNRILEHPKAGIIFRGSKNIYSYDGKNVVKVCSSKGLTLRGVQIDRDGVLHLFYKKKILKKYLNGSESKILFNTPLNHFASIHESNDKTYLLNGREISCILKDSVQLIHQGPENIAYNSINIDGKPYILERELVTRPQLKLKKTLSYKIIDTEFLKTKAEFLIHLDSEKDEIKYVEKGFRFEFLISQFYTNKAYKVNENEIQVINENKLVFPNMPTLDMDKNIWIPTENGVYKYQNNPFKNFADEKLKDVWSINFINDNQFLHTSFSNGAGIYDLATNVSAELNLQKLNRAWYFINSFDGQHFYLPHQDGIYKLHNLSRLQKITDRTTLFTHFDKELGIIIGGIKNGISCYNINSGKTDYFENSDIIKSYPTSILKIDDYYLLTSYSGLYKYKIKEKLFSRVDSISSINIHQDKYDNIWIGSTEAVFTYNKQTQKTSKLSGFDDRSYYLSITSQDDKLFIGSGTEIYMVDLLAFQKDSTLIIKTYNYKNGMMCEEIAQGGLNIYNNKLWIPSATMLATADIQELKFDTTFSNIIINEVNGEKVGFSQDTILLKNNDLKINFSNIGFNSTSISKYRWRIEKPNSNNQFSDWNYDNFAYITDLSRGSYKFEVQSRNSSINLGLNPTASLEIFIDIPIYKNPNFYLYALSIILAFLLGLLYLLRKNSKSKIKAKKNQLELEELKLIKAQREIKILIQQKRLASLEVATAQAQLDPHFFSNILNALKGVINSGDTRMAEKYLVDFSKLIRGFLESSISTSMAGDNTLIENEISIKKEKELLESYLELMLVLYKDEFDYRIKVEHEELLNATMPPMLTQPFVENAIEHGVHPLEQKGNVEIKFSGNEDLIICEIIDNGIGILASKKINSKSIAKHKSRSTEIMKKRIQFLNELDYNIKYEVKDNLPHGTHVILSIEFL